ncbi:MAG: DUF485 domain-containing protein [Deltaproteobacteria bacterium]|nr:DUF485 domain-containing protein [Deltaproteobacteria bacterium]
MSDLDSLRKLESARARVVTALSAATVLVYFGFILLVAFAPARLGALLAPGLSLGIVLGASVIVLSWLFTALYVRWANKRYDPALRALRGRRDG